MVYPVNYRDKPGLCLGIAGTSFFFFFFFFCAVVVHSKVFVGGGGRKASIP